MFDVFPHEMEALCRKFETISQYICRKIWLDRYYAGSVCVVLANIVTSLFIFQNLRMTWLLGIQGYSKSQRYKKHSRYHRPYIII